MRIVPVEPPLHSARRMVFPGHEPLSGGGPHPPLRVAIVDDDGAMRATLAALIEQATTLSCVGQYASVEQAMRGLAAAPTDVLLLDINMPRESGADGVKRLRGAYPNMAVLMLTAFSDDVRVFKSICNGAVGYLLKSITPERLVMAIEDAAGGGSPMSPEIARKVVMLFQRTGTPISVDAALTPSEVRLLSLMARGYTYQAAGDEMSVSVNTIRNYVRSIYEKLHVHSKGEAVAKAFRQGLI
jgi:DNA-binding NarL/FixJ family response regulator